MWCAFFAVASMILKAEHGAELELRPSVVIVKKTACLFKPDKTVPEFIPGTLHLNDFPGFLKCLPEIKIKRLAGFQHQSQHCILQLIFNITHR